jgi:hypothetical protein
MALEEPGRARSAAGMACSRWLFWLVTGEVDPWPHSVTGCERVPPWSGRSQCWPSWGASPAPTSLRQGRRRRPPRHRRASPTAPPAGSLGGSPARGRPWRRPAGIRRRQPVGGRVARRPGRAGRSAHQPRPRPLPSRGAESGRPGRRPGTIWVAHPDTDEVVRLDPGTGRVVARITLDRLPFQVAPGIAASCPRWWRWARVPDGLAPVAVRWPASTWPATAWSR